MSLVTLQSFHSAFDAHMLKARLESAGIESYIFDEHMATINPHLSGAMGGVKLKIREEDHAKALEFLQKIQAENASQPMTCPNCESEDLELDATKKSTLTKFFSWIALLVGQIVGSEPKKFLRCRLCGYKFSHSTESMHDYHENPDLTA